MTDFEFANHGTLTVLTCRTDAAQQWAMANLPDDTLMLGGGYVIEHRYAPPIIEGIQRDGLTVRRLY